LRTAEGLRDAPSAAHQKVILILGVNGAVMTNARAVIRSNEWSHDCGCVDPAALRKALDRRATRTADGGIEAELDGVHARKLGRLWRVALSAAWSNPELAGPSPAKHTRASSQSMRDDREGTRS
jgi:hypothetical protein